jgi:hypothetical protein
LLTLRLVGDRVIDEKSLPCLSEEDTAACREMVVHAQALADRTAAYTQCEFANAMHCLTSYLLSIIQYLGQRGGAATWIERQEAAFGLAYFTPKLTQ